MKLTISQKISPFLWFNDNALEAAHFYVSIFKNSKITRVIKSPDMNLPHNPKDAVLTVAFELDGQVFTALNGGPRFKFNESISFVVSCANQKEVDYYWEKLSKGGKKTNCGWLKDKFGLS
jgi:predicted 3-demethylubiquinone-9 3-methyltransferase (glyoxalase superfamily)